MAGETRGNYLLVGYATMIPGFLLFCAFLFGIGCLSALIEFRIRMEPLYKYFVLSSLLIPAMAFFDVSSFWPDLSQSTRIQLQRMLHLSAMAYVPTALYLIQRITNLGNPIIVRAFFVLCGLLESHEFS